MEFDYLGTVTTSGGFGLLCGIMVGYFIKKIFKVLAVVGGLVLTVILYLSYHGILSINESKLESSSVWLVDLSLKATSAGIMGIVTQETMLSWGLPLTGGLAMGFPIGFMKG